MQNRVQYARPQAMLWSDNPGTLVEGSYYPDNAEYDAGSGIEAFIILSDHNRGAIDVKPNRIEQRQRMINGRMRSYHVADKLTGGEEMLSWYENHTGPFWVFLAYDNYRDFGSDDNAYTHLAQYNQIIEMYITSFDYSIQKRGGTNHDLWNVSVTLEEA